MQSFIQEGFLLISEPARRLYHANVLEKESLEAVHTQLLMDFGPCDMPINGAGGNILSLFSMNAYTPLPMIPVYSNV